MLRSYSRKMPTAAVHMELMATAARANAHPRISHRTRDLNTWADDLTEEKVAGYDSARRWHPTLDSDFFHVLSDLV